MLPQSLILKTKGEGQISPTIRHAESRIPPELMLDIFAQKRKVKEFIPTNIVIDIRKMPEEITCLMQPTIVRPVVVENVIQKYKDGLISLGRAAEISGLTYLQFIDKMKQGDVPLNFGPRTVEEAEQELRDFENWFRKTNRKTKGSH